jgi:hypothetical protein
VRRARGTGGGDRCFVNYPVSTATCPLSVFKIILHATVSENACFGTADITDFYLGSPMPSPEFIIMPADLFSPAALDKVGATPFIQTDRKGKRFFYCAVEKTMPGFRQAGFHAHHQLIDVLKADGYYQVQPCLFTHHTDNIYFGLVVDDFGIKYTNPADFDRLIACLNRHYHVKASPIATDFLGCKIDHDRERRLISLSMPHYISAMLKRFRPNGLKSASSPSIYIPPKYGSTAPQISPIDTSAPATAAQAKRLSEEIGSLLYYARVVDPLLLPATTSLASLQAHPTVETLEAMTRLLGYAQAHPNAVQIIRPSHMLLQTQSDASYLCLPKSGSKAGGHHTLGNHDPSFSNAAVEFISTRIPVVVSSAAEAELAAAFGNAKAACFLRSTLQNIGYPQPATPLFCDNECTIGLTHATVRPKHSKSMDMRFDWLRDRVSQGLFFLPYIPSLLNLADFFTKPLPVHRHLELAPLYTFYPPTLSPLELGQ